MAATLTRHLIPADEARRRVMGATSAVRFNTGADIARYLDVPRTQVPAALGYLVKRGQLLKIPGSPNLYRLSPAEARTRRNGNS